METTDWYDIGHISRAHGIRGEVFVHLNAGEAAWLPEVSELRLTKNKSEKMIPIKAARFHKKGLIVSSEELPDRNTAEDLRGSTVSIPKALLKSKPGEKIYLIEVLNFHLIDPSGKDLGEIVDFSTNTMQDLLVVENANGKYEVPYVDAFVLRTDFEKKEMYVDLPEGLEC